MNQLKARIDSYGPEWPHKSPSIQSLAEAGLYFTPSQDEGDDTVTCFCCAKELGGWESGDDPLSEHLRNPVKSKPCPWALLQNEKRHPTAPPTGAVLLKAREATFKGWPHEKKRGWVGKAKKMAKGGWIFAPTSESADQAECIYCGLALDGWESEDDPTEEHSRRAKDLKCAFFHGLTTSGSAQTILELTKNAFTEQKMAAECDTISNAPSQASTTKTVSTKASLQPLNEDSVGVEKKKTTAKRKLPRTKSKVTSNALIDDEPAADIVQELIPVVLKSARKKRSSILLDPETEDAMGTPVKKARHTRTRSNSFAASTNLSDMLFSSEEKKKPARSHSKVRGRRARTPLEDISDTNIDQKPSVVTAIAEEDGESAASMTAIKTTKSNKRKPRLEQENEDQPVRGRKRSPSMARRTSKEPRARRISGIAQTKPIEETIAVQPASIRDKSDDIDINPTIEEEKENEDEFELAPALQLSSVPPEQIPQISAEVTDDAPTTSAPKRRQSRSSSRQRSSLTLSVAQPITTAGSKRRTSSRRGSGAAASANIEDIVSSAIPSRQSTSSRRISRTTAKIIEEESVSEASSEVKKHAPRRLSSRRGSNAINAHIEDVLSSKPITKKRESSGRRPSSGVTVSSNIESLISSDSQPARRKAGRKPSKPIELSTESITEQEEVEVVPEHAPVESSLAPVVESAEETSTKEELPDPFSNLPKEDFAEHQDESAIAEEITSAHTFDYNDISMIEILDTPKKSSASSSNWTDIPTAGLYHKDMQPASVIRRFADLSEEEREMTVEQWLRMRTKREVDSLTDRCEEMIKTLEHAGNSARAAVLAA